MCLLGVVYGGQHREAKSREAMRLGVERAERALELNPRDARALYLAGGALVYLKERDKGLTWARQALAIGPEDPFVLWNVACVHSAAGEIEAAIQFLEKAYELGFGHRDWVLHDPDMNPLRSHPRFQALLEGLR